MKYAQNTKVTADRSRAEIERVLVRYGARSFVYGWQDGSAAIIFEASGRRIRFTLPMPEIEEFETTPTGRSRGPQQAVEIWEQAKKQRWRALALCVKAKLEAVESGIETFEQAFMAHILLPDGSTVGQFMEPQIERAYVSGKMPATLPMLGEGK